jgi:hypothetical protein
MSPDESSLLVRYSYKNKPWELFVGENKKSTLRQITNSTTKAKAYKWRTPVTFKAQDGTNVNETVQT